MRVGSYFVLFAMTALFHSAVFASGQGKIVVVLDDLGNQWLPGKAALEIPWVTTVAIMPARPFTEEFAFLAHSLNKEIIVHAPMSNQTNFPLGPLGLNKTLTEDEFNQTVQSVIESVPYAVGLSNHMGSKLTQDREAMTLLMSSLKANHFYFLDSRTIASTIAWEVAKQNRVPWAMRNIFLDHFRTHEFMSSQWDKAIQKARQGESVIIICHPYQETITFLSSLIISDSERSYLVPLSTVLHYPTILVDSERNIPKGT